MKIQPVNFVDLKKCRKMSIWLQKSVLIQPRTSLGKNAVSWLNLGASADEEEAKYEVQVQTFSSHTLLDIDGKTLVERFDAVKFGIFLRK